MCREWVCERSWAIQHKWLPYRNSVALASQSTPAKPKTEISCRKAGDRKMKLLLNAATNKNCVSLQLLSGKQDRRNSSKARLLEGQILFMLEKYLDYDYLSLLTGPGWGTLRDWRNERKGDWNDLFSGGCLYARDQTGWISLQCASSAP